MSHPELHVALLYYEPFLYAWLRLLSTDARAEWLRVVRRAGSLWSRREQKVRLGQVNVAELPTFVWEGMLNRTSSL
jgi:hypothetical protein